MKITDLFETGRIILNDPSSSRDEALAKLAGLMKDTGVVDDSAELLSVLKAREDESSTSIGEGVAIPHGKSNIVKKAALAALVTNTPLDWKDPDGVPASLVLMIASPPEGTEHLKILARLMKLLADKGFTDKLKAAASPEAFLSLIDQAEAESLKRDAAKKAGKASAQAGAKGEGYKVLAVTACVTGIAHTYLAAEALDKAGAKLKVPIKVETNGSGGVQNTLTPAEIRAADGIIVAADKKVEVARFNGKKVLFTKVQDGIHKPEELIGRILDGSAPVFHHEGDSDADDEEGIGIGRKIYKDLMNGVSNMLPFVIGGGILIALAFLLDDYSINPANFGSNTPVAAFFKTVGGLAFGFMLPILAGYIAFSIADRPGLAVGFVGGALALSGSSFVNISGEGAISGGFLAALFAGFAGGYITQGLKKLTEGFPRSLRGIKPTLIFPLFGILLIALVMFAVNPIMGLINSKLAAMLNGMGSSSKILLGAILGGMMATDMGGPFNKAAYVFGTAAIAQGNFDIMAAVMIGGMIPPLAIALTGTFFKSRFTPDEQRSSYANYVMGLCFITEGAIPYAAADPVRVIPSCIAGSALAGALSMAFNCGLRAPHGGIFVFPVVDNVRGYLVALVAGSVLGMILLAALKKRLDVGAPAQVPALAAAGAGAPAAALAAAGATLAAPGAAAPGAVVVTAVMNDKEGMHMRPANELAKATKGYASSIALRMHRTGEDGAEELVEADAKSARSVMQSEIRFGETVSIEAVGPDAKEAAETVRALFESGFPLEEKPAATKEPPAAALTASLPGVSPPKVTGAPVSPGIGIGKAYVLSEASLDFSHVVAKDPDTERGRLKGAVDAFVSESREREKEVSERLGKDEAAIFDGHVGLLTDPETQKELDQAIASGKSAEGAVDQVTKKAAAEMAALQSEKFRARAADWEAIRSRLLGNLLGVRTDVSDLGDGGVLVLRELTPFMATGLDRDRVQGIVAETGGKTSHSAILARSMGIPSVMGAAGALLAIKDGDELIVDGDRGEVWASPDDATRAAYEKARVDWLESKKALEAYKDKPTVDADGKRYFVLANVSGPAEAVVAAEAGAEGVGLFRTELIFMGRDTLPTEDEQLDAYSKVADALGDKELIIRTMDIGGDKPVPYLNLPHEDNPFLGFRAIRFCLANKDVFSVQLRAILRASSGRPKIRIMLPMITSVREIQAAKELIATLKDELKAKGVPFNDGIKVGIMVETPAAVQDAELLAGEADFFSIGTNDLTQYTLAADRGNPKLEKLYSHYHPAVLKSVKQVIAAAHSKGKSVGMCGESAGAKGLIPLYISFGLDEWSVSPSSVLSVRREILGWTKKEADELAAHALTLPSTEDVEAYLNEATANRA